MPTPGPLELVIILVIALLVLGPGRLPDVGSALGKSLREFRKAASDVQEATKIDLSPLPPTPPAATPVAPVQASAEPAPAAPTPPPPPTATAAPAPAAPQSGDVPPASGDAAGSGSAV